MLGPQKTDGKNKNNIEINRLNFFPFSFRIAVKNQRKKDKAYSEFKDKKRMVFCDVLKKGIEKYIGKDFAAVNHEVMDNPE